jgi:hypothetical protein
LALLLVLSGMWAFRLGWIAATITETDVITAYSARYLQEHGPAARATDCTARPGHAGGVWIVVTCVGAQTGYVEYAVDRLGRLVQRPALEDGSLQPRT